MSKKINLKMDEELLTKVKGIAVNKFQFRNFNTYSKAVYEALIEFVETNQEFLEPEKIQKNILLKTEVKTND